MHYKKARSKVAAALIIFVKLVLIRAILLNAEPKFKEYCQNCRFICRNQQKLVFHFFTDSEGQILQNMYKKIETIYFKNVLYSWYYNSSSKI